MAREGEQLAEMVGSLQRLPDIPRLHAVCVSERKDSATTSQGSLPLFPRELAARVCTLVSYAYHRRTKGERLENGSGLAPRADPPLSNFCLVRDFPNYYGRRTANLEPTPSSRASSAIHHLQGSPIKPRGQVEPSSGTHKSTARPRLHCAAPSRSRFSVHVAELLYTMPFYRSRRVTRHRPPTDTHSRRRNMENSKHAQQTRTLESRPRPTRTRTTTTIP